MTDKLLAVSRVIADEIHHAVSINSSPDQIFRCFNSSESWNAWFTSDMSLDFRPGGRMVFHWKSWGADKVSTGDHGTVISVIPDKAIEFTWHPDQPDYATKVSLSIEDHRSYSIVRVIETGFADSPEGLHAMIQSASGWGEALTLLKMYIEHGISVVVRAD